jgi:acyl-CoA thioester hydrolase
MVRSETKIRVRYSETDQMGFVYYGVYASYYEVGRVEAMRLLGCSYKDAEDRGILMPVIEMNILYKKPAHYDDEITLITYLKQIPTGYRIKFDYECFDNQKTLLNSGSVTLVFIDKASNKITRIPEWFESAIAKAFNSKL